MTKADFIAQLGEYKAICHTKKTLIDNIVSIVDFMTESDILSIDSLKNFAEQGNGSHPSRMDDSSQLFDRMLSDSVAWMKEQKSIISNAVSQMRLSRKGLVIFAIAVFVFLAATAVVLGVLSVLGKISEAWCNIIGIADCAFGISFFAYELFEDKVIESKINNGDIDTIKKYYTEINIKTGKVENTGDGIINPGVCYGDIVIGKHSDGATKERRTESPNRQEAAPDTEKTVSVKIKTGKVKNNGNGIVNTGSCRGISVNSECSEDKEE